MAVEQMTLDDKFTAVHGRALMSGVQALVRSIIELRRLDDAHGRNTAVLVTGYQGSPLGGVDREMSRARPYFDEGRVIFKQGVNEELAATAVSGSQLLGTLDRRRFDAVTGIWFGKNPGLDRAADAIRHANISGTSPRGGAVAWIGDDPTSKSSTVPSSCEQMCRSLMVPVLAPGTVAETLVLGVHAAAMSRFAGLWTGLKIVAEVADSTALVDFDGLFDDFPQLPERAPTPPPVMLTPTNLDAEYDLMTRRLGRALEYSAAAGLNRITFEPSAPKVAVMAAGLNYQVVLRALADLGLDERDFERLGLRLVQIQMPWPIDGSELRRFTAGVDTVLVVEDKLAFLESLVKEALYRTPDAPEVFGKYERNGRPLLTARSALSSDDVIAALTRLLPVDRPARTSTGLRQLTLLPTRTPSFCSGCPHSASTKAGPDQLVGVGIGCHTLVALDNLDRRGHLLGMPQMGGEGAQWIGLAPFTDDPHFIQNLGDGTFHHSGSLAIRAAVASGANITYRVLVNDVVAMTGGQMPVGQMDIPVMTKWLALEGVRKVVVTTDDPKAWRNADLDPIASVRGRDELDAVQRELAQVPGVTALLHVDRCATEERRLRKRGKLEAPAERVWINERVCEGCGDCGDTSACLSVVPVDTEFGRKTAIHQSSCNQDFACVAGNCPSFVMVTPEPGRRTEAAPGDDVELAEPTYKVAGDVLIRMTGVGGTGVVTVSQILQMAAHLDGGYGAGLDQIGLAQKGGPVVSDIRLSRSPIEGQLKAGRGTVDVLLGFDSLGATTEATLAALAPGRCVAIINEAEVLTAEMVGDETVKYPALSALMHRIDSATGTRDNLSVDALGLAERFFGDHMLANMVVIGAAYQHGAIPLPLNAIEQAIRLNGAAVEANLSALRVGRLAVARPELLLPAVQAPPAPHPEAVRLVADTGLGAELTEQLTRLTGELIAYQNVDYARRFLTDVRAVAEVVRQHDHAADEVVGQVAAGLFKLMAYKDEYEVARLHLDSAMRARRSAEFGPNAKVRYLLFPPILRLFGLNRKIAFGAWITPAFRVLYAARRLRGSWLDPFGKDAVRRVERVLPAEYLATVWATLSAPGYDRELVRRASALADVVRGYDEVKLNNVASFRAAAAELTERKYEAVCS